MQAIKPDVFKKHKQAGETRDGRFLNYHEELRFALQMYFAGFSHLPLELVEINGNPMLMQHKFLVNPDQSLAYCEVRSFPRELSDRSFLDDFDTLVRKIDLEEDKEDKIPIRELPNHLEKLMTNNLEVSQDFMNLEQEIIFAFLLRILYVRNGKIFFDNISRSEEDKIPLWDIHLTLTEKINANDEKRKVMDFSFSKRGKETEKLLKTFKDRGFRYGLRQLDNIDIYVYFVVDDEPWLDTENSAFFKCYVNPLTFSKVPIVKITEEMSRKLYQELEEHKMIIRLKDTIKSKFGLAPKRVDYDNLDAYLPSGYINPDLDLSSEDFISIFNKLEFTEKQQEHVVQFIEKAEERSFHNFSYLVAASLPGYNIEMDDPEMQGKINAYTCKIMTGAGRIILDEDPKKSGFKYRSKDNNGIIQGFSCGRHTEKEVQALYDFIMFNGCKSSVQDYIYMLSVIDDASCGRRNRAYWLEAIIKGLMDPHLRKRQDYLFDIMEEEYGRERAKEIMSLDPSGIVEVAEKIKGEIEKLAEIKFGPVKLVTIAKGIVNMVF